MIDINTITETAPTGAPGAPALTRRTNLMLHCGASRVEREHVFSVPTPEPTETWHPLPHITLLNTVETALLDAGHRIVQTENALTRDGRRYFGVIQVARVNATADVTFVVGIRNSHDKSLPAGLVAGSQVFVCDNLAFCGEVSLSRKHTKFIRSELNDLVAGAVRGVEALWSKEDARIAAYKSTVIKSPKAHDIIIRAMESGVCAGAHIPQVVKEWHRPSHEAFRERTVWSLHNAFTEALKGNLTALPFRTSRLHRLLDPVAGVPELAKS
jgi:hypothetical protein